MCVNPNAAGIDVGSQVHYVAVPPGRSPRSVRAFGAITRDLYALAHWLKSLNIKTVAMESTGVYWIPLMYVLEERGFEVLLVDPHHFKSVPARKSDVLD
ncbi:MAG: transposase, partial [Acidobacteriota bacterium]